MYLIKPDIFDILDRVHLAHKCILKIDKRYYVTVKFHDRDNLYIGNSRGNTICHVDNLGAFLSTTKSWKII